LNDLIITKLDNASRLLSEAKTLQETKSIVDIAAAAEVYARRQQLGEEAIGHAHEIKIYALCKLGEMLKGTPRNEGALKQGPVVPQGNHGNIPTLKDLRISKKISSLAQKLSGLRDGKVDSIARREQSLTQVLRQERAEQSMVATSETIANGSRGRILPLEALWQSPKQILSSYDFMSALRSHMDGFQPRLVGSLPMEVLAVPVVLRYLIKPFMASFSSPFLYWKWEFLIIVLAGRIARIPLEVLECRNIPVVPLGYYGTLL